MCRPVCQEKLASDGRSAGISHEIRNPLAAIAQANALMLRISDGAQHWLARIVEDNAAAQAHVDDVGGDAHRRR